MSSCQSLPPMQLLSSHKFGFWALGLFSSSGACASSCTHSMWDFMQMTTRYLSLSRPLLGPVAELSCISCINAVAVADRHFTEIMWRQGLQSLVQHSHMFMCFNSGQWGTCVKCSGPGIDMVQGGLYQTRNCKDSGTWFSLPNHSTKWSCCFELLSSLESPFVKPFLRQGVLQVCFGFDFQ